MAEKKAEYGRGSIRQRGSRWQIRYYVDGVDENGQPTHKRVEETFKTKTEARKRLNQVVGAIADGKHVTPAGDKLKFSDLERLLLVHFHGMKSEKRAVGRVGKDGKRTWGCRCRESHARRRRPPSGTLLRAC